MKTVPASGPHGGIHGSSCFELIQYDDDDDDDDDDDEYTVYLQNVAEMPCALHIILTSYHHIMSYHIICLFFG